MILEAKMIIKHIIMRSRSFFGIFSFWAISMVSILIIGCTTNSSNKLASNAVEENLFTQRIEGEAQGTTYSIIYIDSLSRNIKKEVDSILLNFDYSLSTYNSKSLISLINTKEDTIDFIDSFGYVRNVFELSKEVFARTKGAFDPTVMPLVKAWGFGKKKVREMDTLQIDSLLALVGFDKIKLEVRGTSATIVKKDASVQLDFNAIAQGYSIDVLATYLEQLGVRNYLIELGGEIVSKGKNPRGVAWSAQLDKPVEGNYERVGYAKITLSNEGLATSGNYRKFHTVNGMKVSHTISPFTGYPVNHSLLSATVLANNCALADGYATAMMVMGTEKSVQFLAENPTLGLLVYFISGEKDGFNTYQSADLEKRVEKYKENL